VRCSWLKEMPELRAPEKSRTGMEIKPKVKYPDQTEEAIVRSLEIVIRQFCGAGSSQSQETPGSSLD